MTLQLQPLSSRPDLYVTTENGIKYTTSEPHALISSRSFNALSSELCHYIRVRGDVCKVHYAGTGAIMNKMYFFEKKERGLFFEPKFFLVRVDIKDSIWAVFKEIEPGNVTMFHRQPFYLLRTGFGTWSWIIKHFDTSEPHLSIDLTDISLDNALLIQKKVKLFILRNGRKERIETDSFVIFQHPDLDSNCTAYVDDLGNQIYVALSTKPEMLVINAESLAIETVMLPEILDIRHASSGVVIFASVRQQDKELRVGQLEHRFWKGNSKDAGQELAAANAKINQLLKELESLKSVSLENLMSKIIEERDLLAVQKEELEKKYRMMLLRFGRQTPNTSKLNDLAESTKKLTVTSPREDPLREGSVVDIANTKERSGNSANNEKKKIRKPKNKTKK